MNVLVCVHQVKSWLCILWSGWTHRGGGGGQLQCSIAAGHPGELGHDAEDIQWDLRGDLLCGADQEPTGEPFHLQWPLQHDRHLYTTSYQVCQVHPRVQGTEAGGSDQFAQGLCIRISITWKCGNWDVCSQAIQNTVKGLSVCQAIQNSVKGRSVCQAIQNSVKGRSVCQAIQNTVKGRSVCQAIQNTVKGRSVSSK